MPTASRATMRKELAQLLYVRDPFLTGSATAAGTTATLVDSNLVSTQAGNLNLVRYWLYIDSMAADAAPEGEARMVSQFAPVTGTLTVDPVFTAAPSSASSATYELHPRLHPDRLNEALNWSLEVGSRFGYAAITDDDLTSSAIYDKQILYQGALYYVKQGMCHDPDLDASRLQELTQQWQQHYRNWEERLEAFLNYSLPKLRIREVA